MKDRKLTKRSIDTIVVGERQRQDLGNISGLAASIAKIGLIYPLVITSEGILISGERRLEACKHLGWKIIACVEANDLESAATQLRAEQDDYTERKHMSFFERMNFAQTLLDLERPNQLRYQRQADNVVGELIGWSGTTLTRARAVLKAYNDESLTEEQREVVKAAIEEIITTGHIAGGYEIVRKMQKQRPQVVKKQTNSGLARNQRYVFDKGLPNIAGSVLSLQRIEELDPAISDEEIDQWIKGLSESRRSLEQIIRRLKEKKNAQVS